MRYGIPSAGVLCVELLKSAKGAPGTQAQAVHFSRSEVVQSLTMFLGFLDWIRPSDGNYRLCQRLRQVIKGILGCVLDSTSPPQSDPIPETDSQTNRIPNDGNGDLLLNSMQMPMIGGDAIDWLNTIDWTQGNWLDFNIPTLYQWTLSLSLRRSKNNVIRSQSLCCRPAKSCISFKRVYGTIPLVVSCINPSFFISRRCPQSTGTLDTISWNFVISHDERAPYTFGFVMELQVWKRSKNGYHHNIL